ncbi:MAG: GNAT family N-acetyltransferase [Pseudomonadota bacterium]
MAIDDVTLWSEGAYRLTVSDSAGADWLQFVSHARFGAPGARYRRHRFADEATQFAAPLFCSLYHGSSIVGCYVLDRRRLLRAGAEIDGLYRGTLFVDPAHRGHGLARIVVERAVLWAVDQGSLPVLTYGCVERRNAAAQRVLATQGMQRLGSVGSALKYSHWPRASLPPHAFEDGRSDAIGALLSQTQAGDSLVDAAPAQWISAHRNGAVAGCVYHVVSLNLDQPTGGAGRFMQRAMQLFPPARKRFAAEDFRYVAIRQPVAAGAGAAKLFQDLLDHLLVQHSTHFANVSLDEGDGTASARAVRQALGRRCVARRRLLDVLGRWHGTAPFDAAPIDAMQLSAPDL